ncbi:MAG: phoU 2 [Bacteroidetes bacterium]|nr:phoU 2 [Bacteroidota bacterium]
MERHFTHELESLKTFLIKMASMVETNLVSSIQALMERNELLAAKVIENDRRIDSLEIEIDNIILDLLALQHPVASDLRFIIAAQKINNDLERISDHAVNIAQSVPAFKTPQAAGDMIDIPTMVDLAKAMLRDALDSFIRVDPSLAQSVIKQDDVMDDLNRKMSRKVVELIKAGTQSIESGLELNRVSRNLERVADLTTNIAEEVIFLSQARIVKHGAGEKL